MKKFRHKEVLITGAGSGIGQATAVAFARQGARLWLADIDEQGNQQTAEMVRDVGGVARTLYCNVAEMESVQQTADAVHAEIDALDILMNNAGIASGGRFLDSKPDTWRRVIDINLMGVLNGCHCFLPAMVARGKGGYVVNTASAAAFIAVPDMPIYGASKFAVLGFSESLRADMADHNIGVSAICPGIINTPIVSHSIMEGAIGDRQAHQKVEEFYQKRNYTADQVASAVLSAIRHKVAVKPVSPEAWGMYYAKRLVPGVVQRVIRMKVPLLNK